MGAFVEGIWCLHLQCTFSKPIFLPFFISYVLRNKLKAIVLAWYPNNNNVIHKYLTETKRLACDETPFLLVVYLRTTTLVWWPDDGNVILVNTHDHDRLARDETSHPPTNRLSILLTLCKFPEVVRVEEIYKR